MEILVNYEEYCKNLNLPWDESTTTPDWFDNTEYLALAIISTNMAQLHLFPQSYAMFLMLKPDYSKQFVRALCNQIRFINDNRDLFEDPISLQFSNTIGNYSRTAMSPNEVMWYQSRLCPVTQMTLLSMGWLYAGIDRKIPMEEYYNLQ